MSIGLSKTRLDRMHNVMVGYVARGEAPGMITLVSRCGVTHVDAIGRMAIDGQEPMCHDAVLFRKGSTS